MRHNVALIIPARQPTSAYITDTISMRRNVARLIPASFATACSQKQEQDHFTPAWRPASVKPFADTASCVSALDNYQSGPLIIRAEFPTSAHFTDANDARGVTSTLQCTVK
eukprot:scaffold76591_cov17-Tisochrysis_lutea.AAC.1